MRLPHPLYTCILLLITVICLRPWLGHEPERWWATHSADLRTYLARTCARSHPQAAPPGAPAAPLRLLVCVAAGPFRQPRYSQLEAALAEYLSYNASRFEVTVMVDTVSAQVASSLHARFARVPAGMHFKTTLWGTSELEALFPASAGWGGEPAEFLVSHAHRLYMHKLRADFDYFVYAEDDMLVPEAAITLLAERSAKLWPLGWLVGFLRVEVDGAGQPSNPDMLADSLRPNNLGTPDAALRGVYTATDHLYAALGNPYGAVWALSREQLESFVSDPTGVYATGAMAFDMRARMSWGYLMAHQPDGKWAPRALLPMGRNGGVDPHARVFHLPSNYCGNGSACATLEQMNTALRAITPLPLTAHPAQPCNY